MPYFVRYIKMRKMLHSTFKKTWSDMKGSHFDHLIFKCFTDDGSLASWRSGRLLA